MFINKMIYLLTTLLKKKNSNNYQNFFSFS